MMLWVTTTLVACRAKRKDLNAEDYVVKQTWSIDDVSFGEMVQFEDVFWEPDDTISLRRMIVDDALVKGRTVLEIGTGTGLVAIVSAQNGASGVVATDINPAAFANARYNAAMLETEDVTEFRLVPKDSPGAFAVMKEGETFDLILSNPPWEDGKVTEDLDHAYYDPGFELMDSLLDGLPKRLNPGGRCLLAYGHVAAIKRLQKQAQKRGFSTDILDDRKLDDLPADFLPGMLVEVKLPTSN